MIIELDEDLIEFCEVSSVVLLQNARPIIEDAPKWADRNKLILSRN